MASPTRTLQAAAAHLKTSLPGLGTCALYAGELTGLDAGKPVPIAPPAVLPAFLGLIRKADVDCGQVDWQCRFCAYCLTKHAGGREHRAVTALELAEQVLAHIDGQRFGLAGLFPATVTRIDNLYSPAFDKALVAVQAVTWEQTVRMGADQWAAEGTRPESLYIGYSPEIGAGHEDDYILAYQEQVPEEPEP